MLLLLGLVAILGRGTLSLLHSFLFAVTFEVRSHTACDILLHFLDPHDDDRHCQSSCAPLELLHPASAFCSSASQPDQAWAPLSQLPCLALVERSRRAFEACL
jgi:hypothetical protein